MEETIDLVQFIVIGSTSVVLLLAAVLVDIIVLFRKRKVIAQQQIELRENKIDELIMKKEVESMNSLLKGQNTERRRISQELHDRLGSILFTAKLYHSNLETKVKAEHNNHDEGFEKLTDLLDDAVQEVRRISHDLYAGSLTNFDYSTALRQLITAIEESDSLKIELTAEEDVNNLNEEIQYELYAITQELLSNTLKHAKASKVEIELRTEGELIFHYHDNGNGFDSEGSFSGIGLKNIKNRVNKFDGKLTVESTPRKGTFYFITIPLPR